MVPADFDTSIELANLFGGETGTGNVVFSASPTFDGTADFSAINVGNAFTLGDGGNSGSINTLNWGITTTGVITNAEWNGDVIADTYLTKTGNWTGTFDGQEGAHYLDLANATGDTGDIAEGTNLYFTNARADARIAATTTLLTSLP